MEKTSNFRHSRLGYVGNGTGRYAKSSQGTEAKLVNKIMDALRRDLKNVPYFIYKTHGGTFQKAGIPDIYLQTSGRALWLEIKLPGGDTTALQRKTLLELKDAGAYVATCTSVEEAIDTLHHALSL